MAKKKKKKAVVKRIVKAAKSDVDETKEEIKDLEVRKEKFLKETEKKLKGKEGFKKIAIKAGAATTLGKYKKAIGERQKFLRGTSQLRLLKQKAELEGEKAKLIAAREKTKKLFKPISTEDIFGKDYS